MCPRRYRLGKREADVQATRDAILSAARDLFEEAGYYRTSVEDIARRADVAPATVYYQFGSKPGLLDAALASILDRPATDAALGDADGMSDPELVIATAVRRVCQPWAEEAGLLRSLLGLGDVDPALRPVIEARDQTRRSYLRSIAASLAGADALAPGYDEGRAADVLSMLTSFASFDHLVSRCGLGGTAAIESLTALALALIGPARRSDPVYTAAVPSSR